MKYNTKKIYSIIYMVAQMLAFVLAFAINVIMTNYSGNSEIYGQYKYATNFVLTIPAIFSLGISWSCASLMAKDDCKNKQGVMTASIVYTAIIGLIVTIGLYIIYYISAAMGKPQFKNLLIVFPFAGVFLVQKLINQIYTGSGQALKLSLYSVAPNAIVTCGMIIYIVINKNLDYVFSILLYLLSYVIVIIPKLLGIKYNFFNFKLSSKQLFDDVRKSGIKVHVSTIFTTSSSQIIALCCGSIYGYTEYGFYSLAASLALVFQLIGSSLATVNFKHYANSEKIESKDFVFMGVLGLFAYICMWFLINIMFFWFYPKSYAPTIYYLKILCFSNLLYGFSAMFNRFFIGKGLGVKVMTNSMVTAVATLVVNISMIMAFKMQGLVWASVIVSLICLITYCVQYRLYLKSWEKI